MAEKPHSDARAICCVSAGSGDPPPALIIWSNEVNGSPFDEADLVLDHDDAAGRFWRHREGFYICKLKNILVCSSSCYFAESLVVALENSGKSATGYSDVTQSRMSEANILVIDNNVPWTALGIDVRPGVEFLIKQADGSLTLEVRCSSEANSESAFLNAKNLDRLYNVSRAGLVVRAEVKAIEFHRLAAIADVRDLSREMRQAAGNIGDLKEAVSALLASPSFVWEFGDNLPVDPWGRQYRFIHSADWIVVSDGPDLTPSTADDIVSSP